MWIIHISAIFLYCISKSCILLVYPTNHPEIYVDKTQVCSPFYRRAIGLSRTRYYRLRQQVANHGGAPPTDASNPWKRKRKSPTNVRKREMAYFMESRFKMWGNYVPNLQEVHLPCLFSKVSEWTTYRSRVGKDEALDFATFCRYWKSEFPAVKIIKSSDFAKCDTCSVAKSTMDALSTGSVHRGMPQACFYIMCDGCL